MYRYLILVAFILTGCSVSFDVTTDEYQMDVNNTYGFYAGTVVESPSQTQRSNVTIDEVEIYYTATKSNSFYTNMSVYASTDTTADMIKGANDEKLFDVTLTQNQTTVSDSVYSDMIKQGLKQPKFVIGVENLIAGLPTDKTHLSFRVRVKGKYRLF